MSNEIGDLHEPSRFRVDKERRLGEGIQTPHILLGSSVPPTSHLDPSLEHELILAPIRNEDPVMRLAQPSPGSQKLVEHVEKLGVCGLKRRLRMVPLHGYNENLYRGIGGLVSPPIDELEERQCEGVALFVGHFLPAVAPTSHWASVDL